MGLLGGLLLFVVGIVLMFRSSPLLGCGFVAVIVALMVFGNHPGWFEPFAWTLFGLLVLLLVFAFHQQTPQHDSPAPEGTVPPPDAPASSVEMPNGGLPQMAPRRMEPKVGLRVGFHTWTVGPIIEEPPDLPALPSPRRRRRLK